jgi:hypothetical protein
MTRAEILAGRLVFDRVLVAVVTPRESSPAALLLNG